MQLATLPPEDDEDDEEDELLLDELEVEEDALLEDEVPGVAVPTEPPPQATSTALQRPNMAAIIICRMAHPI